MSAYMKLIPKCLLLLKSYLDTLYFTSRSELYIYFLSFCFSKNAIGNLDLVVIYEQFQSHHNKTRQIIVNKCHNNSLFLCALRI